MSNPHIKNVTGHHEAAPPAGREPGPADGNSGAQGPWTVLLVEDDVLIRMDAADMLRELGYEVLEAEYGPDALMQLRERPIDVLVTDVGLPGMSGTELAERARQLQPHIGLVFATGDTELESREGRPRAAILCKPYDSASLAESVRGALARP
ncbi:response regulator [Frateuria sp. GZRR33]|uniref:response regulator n=1 Tax=Frateuria sp. GZRR33 TaxID=3351535 RepID=UPI003EDC240C